MPESFVSLFTREWIEILYQQISIGKSVSPSLRGSGLKLLAPLPDVMLARHVSLFTREWIEITRLPCLARAIVGLPLYEGVD